LVKGRGGNGPLEEKERGKVDWLWGRREKANSNKGARSFSKLWGRKMTIRNGFKGTVNTEGKR